MDGGRAHALLLLSAEACAHIRATNYGELAVLGGGGSSLRAIACSSRALFCVWFVECAYVGRDRQNGSTCCTRSIGLGRLEEQTQNEILTKKRPAGESVFADTSSVGR
jgi:hypothetical protein